MAEVLAGPPPPLGATAPTDRARVTRPIGAWGFGAVAVCSLGGPLALAALMAPSLVGEAGASAGLVGIAGLIVSAAPLAIWLRFAAHVHGPGGLTGFVEAAAGRRVALLQATIWTISYLLYLVYTTVQIVYDVLPVAIPGERGVQSALVVLVPLALIGVMMAGRTATLIVLGVIAAGQLAVAASLDAVTIAHLHTPVSSFRPGAGAGPLARAGTQASLLYVCGSLPLFLGGELAQPRRVIGRGLPVAFALTGLVVIAALAPLAAAPGLATTAIPGMTVMAQFAGAGAARLIGVGVAVSIAGVMVCEYLALTRLAQAVLRWRPRRSTGLIGAVMLAATPLILADPQGAYNTLLEPSLIALWLSQLIVFACYPRFARRVGHRVWSARALSLTAGAWALYALYTTINAPST
jgi:hypothetical protein